MGGRAQRGRALVAAVLAGLAAGAPAPPETAAAGAYREALASQALGRETEAWRRLAKLEAELIAAGFSFERLRQIEIGVIRELPPAPPEALLPVIVLHERARLAYRRQGSEPHAFHARTCMFLVAELFAARADTDERRRLAADLLAVLGGDLMESSTGAAGSRLFTQALKLDGSNEAALLGAAIEAEQSGHYARALGLLERLARAHPANPEGQLRLAINRLRAGRAREADEVLGRLLAGGAPAWILSLAHQTRARLLLDDDRPEEASRALAAAIADHPDDSALAIAHAWAAERAGSGEGGRDLRTALERSARSPERPPRYRYSRPPSELFERTRRGLRRRAADGRQALAEVLAYPPAAGSG